VGRGHSQGGNQKSKSDAPILKDLGISLDQSSQWQRLAAIPEDEFEGEVLGAGTRQATGGGRETRSGLLVAPAIDLPSANVFVGVAVPNVSSQSADCIRDDRNCSIAVTLILWFPACCW
jgi:hypothetical protein